MSTNTDAKFYEIMGADFAHGADYAFSLILKWSEYSQIDDKLKSEIQEQLAIAKATFENLSKKRLEELEKM